jgi:4'-phosphopantetheinyl transferase
VSDSIGASRGGEEAPRVADTPVRRLAATPFNIELWLVDLARAPVTPALLSRAELARAARFVFEADRQKYLAAHCALAELLAARLQLPSGHLEFQVGPHDKPRLSPAYDCVFNMSHCDDRALIGIALGLPHDVEIGVDIERLREVSDARALSAANFTAPEQMELAGCEPAMMSQAFLRGWTRKEACLKAIGSGLTIHPATFNCGLGQRPGVTEIDGVTIEFDSLDVGTGHIAAIAITRPGMGGARAVVH